MSQPKVEGTISWLGSSARDHDHRGYLICMGILHVSALIS